MSPQSARRGIAHEIRGELTAVRGHAELLIRGGDQLDVATRREFAQSIDDAGAAIERLLDGLGPSGLVPALDALLEPVTLLDAELRVVHANAAQRSTWKAIFGQDLQRGTSLLEALADRPQERDRAERLLARALDGERFTVTRTIGEGTGARHVETTYTPVADASGAVTAVVTIVRDAGQSPTSPAAVVATPDPDAPSFAGRLSHQLRSPAHTILGYASLLGEDPTDGVALAEIQRAARRLVRFSDDLLQYAKLDDERSRVSIEPVELLEVAQRAQALVLPLATERGIRMELTIDGSAVALADRSTLIEVLAELLDNAIRHGGSIVRISSSEIGDRVAVVVEDDGPGIPVALRPRAQEAFVASPQAGEDGIGLGLALASRLLGLVGGALEIEDATVGACLRLTLARPTDADRPAPVFRADALTQPLDREVLLVEDNVGAARLVRSAFRLRPGLRVTVAGSVAEGLAAVRSTPFDLALIDLHLPDGSGFTVIEAIRATELGTIVGVLTADATQSARTRAKELSVDRFLTKPFAVDELLSLVDATPPLSR